MTSAGGDGEEGIAGGGAGIGGTGGLGGAGGVGEGGATMPVAGSPAIAICGDGTLDADESCDDGSAKAGDGCSATCGVETGWVCSGSPSVCNRSCYGSVPTCGSTMNHDCCEALLVDGGSFLRDDDETLPAKISSFYLDAYELSVSRFRAFVNAYPSSRPVEGAGRNVHNPADSGWNSAWDALLPADRAGLIAAVNCKDGNRSWMDIAGATETFPMNCIDWYEAEAFCVWDGGRLPTDAEWTYAASGGDEQRYYPWSVPAQSQTLDATYALYNALQLLPVGSKKKGKGKWGQLDLAGSVNEWVQDGWKGKIDATTCDNCANLTTSGIKTIRGGQYNAPASDLNTAGKSNRAFEDAPARFDSVGTRCARNR